MATNSLNRIVLAGACMFAAGISQAQVTLNFDELAGTDYIAGSSVPDGAQLSDDYLSAYGIKFTSGAGYAAVVNLGPEFTPSSPNGLAGTTPEGLVTYASSLPITMSFWDPTDPSKPAEVTTFSLTTDLAPLDGQLATLNAYDTAGNLVGSFTTQAGAGQIFSLAIPGGIHSLTFLGSPTDADGIAIDNVTFGELHAVPEPATLLALSLGTLLIAKKRARRRRL